MANAAMGSVPLREVLMVTQNEGCTQALHKHILNTSYISQMDRTNVQSFAPVSKRFPSVCCVTRSLEMPLAPSSQGRNHLVQ